MKRSGGNPRVLVVDDNEDAAESLAALLSVWSYDTEVAHDGKAALDAARRRAPSAVILDIGLPDIDGYEVSRRLRQLPELGATVLIAVTGRGLEEDRRRARDAGFDEHLTKPVDPDVLRAILERLRK